MTVQDGRTPEEARRAGSAAAYRLAPDDAKLRIPAVRPGLVHREGLVARLTDADAPSVVLCSAPAGYGKTTLLAEWAARDRRPFAWVSLSERERDPAVLVAYLARALDAVTGLDTGLGELSASGADLFATLLPRLGAVLHGLREPVVVVLDDVHLVEGSAALHVVEALVANLPGGSGLALAARRDPAITLGRLRAEGRLLRLGPDDLRLDDDEARRLLDRAGADLAAPALAELLSRVEGWPAGLYLAALSLRSRPGAAAVREFGGDDRLVAELLHEEHLRGLPDDTVEFLTRSSVLERLSAASCDAVLERSDSGRLLAMLERSNLFLVPLDPRGEAFRYHHLFADLLRFELRRREPELEPVLHARASDWFAAHGDVDTAVGHAIASGDLERAEALIWPGAATFLAIGRGATVDRWLGAFSDEQLVASTVLALTRAWRGVTGRSPESVDHWTAIAERGRLARRLPDGTHPAAVVATLHALVGAQGAERMLADAREAIALDDVGTIWFLVARLLEGAALRLLGQVDASRACFADAERRAAVAPVADSLALTQLALIEIDAGHWSQAEVLSARARRIVGEYGLTEQPAQSCVYAVSAFLHARAGEDDDARRELQRARHLLAALNDITPWLAIETRFVLARAALLLGDVASAQVLGREAERLLALGVDWGALTDVNAALREETASVMASTGIAVAPLTTAELRVLRYMPTHLSLAAIAAELFVSRNTVKTQAIAIYRKLGVSSREAAVGRARELGLLPDLEPVDVQLPVLAR